MVFSYLKLEIFVLKPNYHAFHICMHARYAVLFRVQHLAQV